jgi:uncharacterized protein YyaL (SSP411 family)
MATMRIQDADHQIVRALAERTGKQHQEIIHEALDAYQRESLLDEINAGFSRLRSDESEWDLEKQERKLWENTLSDGIDP